MVGFWVDRSMAEAIDKARGPKSKSLWLREAVLQYLAQQGEDCAKITLKSLDRAGIGRKPRHPAPSNIAAKRESALKEESVTYTTEAEVRRIVEEELRAALAESSTPYATAAKPPAPAGPPPRPPRRPSRRHGKKPRVDS